MNYMSLLNQSITSDKDYLKIFDDGQVLISANGGLDADSTYPADPSAPLGFVGSRTIPHTLGSIPLVRAFWDPAKNGRWYSADCRPGDIRLDPWLKFIATTTGVKLIMNTDGAAKTNIPVFYRIYDLGLHATDSDSRIDKVFMKDTSFGQVAATGSSLNPNQTVLPIPHPAGEAPLWTLEFADNPNGPWYPEGLQIIGAFDTTSGPAGGPYSRYYYLSAFGSVDRNNLYVTLESNYGSVKTIYVRFALDYRA